MSGLTRLVPHFLGGCLIGLLLLAIADVAGAQGTVPPHMREHPSACFDTTTVVNSLHIDSKESPIVVGKQTNEDRVLVWTSAARRTYTITITRGNVTCLIAAGELLQP